MKTQKSYTVEEATKALEHFCAYQERSHSEIEKKLAELNMIPEAKELIIIHLIQHDFLNEERFAKSFVSGKFNIKKWGRIKITNELKKRRVSLYNIKTALKEIKEDEYLETLKIVATKKCALIRESNPYKKSQKLSNYLISRGFESNLVYQTVAALIPK